MTSITARHALRSPRPARHAPLRDAARAVTPPPGDVGLLHVGVTAPMGCISPGYDFNYVQHIQRKCAAAEFPQPAKILLLPQEVT